MQPRRNQIPSGGRRGPLWRGSALLFHVGFLTLIAQALLAREFLVLYHGSEVALGVFYAAWLAWIGAGAAAFLPFARRRAPGEWLLAAGLVALPFAVLAEVALLRWGRVWLGVSAVEIVPLGWMAAATVVATVVVGFPAGLLFAASCRSVADATSKVSVVPLLFACEALGGFVGGVVHTFFLVEYLSTDATIWLLVVLVSAHLIGWAWAARFLARWGWIMIGVVLAALGLFFVSVPTGQDLLRDAQEARFVRTRPGFEWIETVDSRYGRLELARRDHQYTLFANGQVAMSFPNVVDHRRAAALAMSQCSRGAQSVLLLGSADAGLLAELLAYPSIERIDAVDIDPAAARLVRPYLDGLSAAALAGPRVRIHHVDPRAFANRATAPGAPYDLVLIEAPDPSSVLGNRLFTLEFYKSLRRHMRTDGVVVTGVQSSANYVGHEVSDYAGAVVATVRRVFPHVMLTPGDRMTILASGEEGTVRVDAEELAVRYRRIAPPDGLFRPEAFATLLPSADVAAVARRFADPSERLNTDAQPMAYYLATIVWSRFSASDVTRRTFAALDRHGAAVALIPLLIFWLARLLYVSRWSREEGVQRLNRFNAVTTVAGLGALGMAASLMFLMAYQSSVGLLYGRIGLLAGVFMLGLGLGAFVGGRSTPGGRASLRVLGPLCAIVCLFALAPACFGWGPERFGGAALVGLGLFGLVVGWAFAAASRLFGDAPGRTGAWLDMADHAGGAFGAIATGAIAVPLLGFHLTCAVSAAVALGLLALHAQAAFPARHPVRSSAPGDALRPWVWALAAFVLATYLLGGWMHLQTRQIAPPLSVPQSLLAQWKGDEGGEWAPREEPFGYWVHQEDGSGAATSRERRRVAFATDATAPDVRGYGGPLFLALDAQRRRPEGVRVRHVEILRHSETPAYVSGLAAWIAGLQDLTVTKPLVLGRDIEGVTGATVTCRAVVNALNRSAFEGGNALLDAQFDPSVFGHPTWRQGLFRMDSLALLACLLLFVPAYLWGGDRARVAFLCVVTVVFGLWLNRAFTLLDVGALTVGELPANTNIPGWVLWGGIAVTAMLWGCVFCGWLCPFGALQELVERGVRRAVGRGGRSRLGPGLRALRFLRYVLAAVALSGFWLAWAGDDRWLTWSPLQTAFSSGRAPVLWCVLALLLVATALVPRFWCLFLCPAGAALSLLNRLTLLERTRWFRQPRFTACDLGASAERPRDCLRCNRCLAMEPPTDHVSRRRAGAILAACVLVCAVLAMAHWNADATERGAPSTTSETRARNVDIEAVDRAIEAGRLSDREALFYEPASTDLQEENH